MTQSLAARDLVPNLVVRGLVHGCERRGLSCAGCGSVVCSLFHQNFLGQNLSIDFVVHRVVVHGMMVQSNIYKLK